MRFKALVFLAMIFDLEEIKHAVVFNLDIISVVCCFYRTGYTELMKAVCESECNQIHTKGQWNNES